LFAWGYLARKDEESDEAGDTMPDPSKLSTATGQLGPVCSITGQALTFAEAIVLDNEYVCWEAYVEATGAAPATEGKQVPGLHLD